MKVVYETFVVVESDREMHVSVSDSNPSFVSVTVPDGDYAMLTVEETQALIEVLQECVKWIAK